MKKSPQKPKSAKSSNTNKEQSPKPTVTGKQVVSSASLSDIPVKITPMGQPVFPLYLAGTDYEIGRKRGSELTEDCLHIWKAMEGNFSTAYGCPADKWDFVAGKLEKNLKAVAPWMLEQMQGMADAGACGMRELLLINYYGLIWSNAGNWCTSVAIRDSDEGPLLGQNLDIGFGNCYYQEEIHPAKGRSTLSYAMTGMCWSTCAVNDKGLCVGSSVLPAPAQSKTPWNWDGVNYHFLPYFVLRECGSVPEAIEYLKSLPPTIPSGGGYHLNMIDPAGNMMVVDCSGSRKIFRQCDPDLNFTSNCTLDPEMEEWRLGSKNSYPDGIARVNRIRQEWKQLSGTKPTRKWLTALMMSDTGDGCICRWADNSGYSRLGFIFSARDKTMDISNGPPNRTPYEHFKFTEK
jgi:hypothetical protein